MSLFKYLVLLLCTGERGLVMVEMVPFNTSDVTASFVLLVCPQSLYEHLAWEGISR